VPVTRWQSSLLLVAARKGIDDGIECCASIQPTLCHGCLRSIWEIPGIKAGVVTGDVAWALLAFAKSRKFAIPAFNVTSSSVIVAVLEAAKAVNSPIIIQFSHGGLQFMAGKALDNIGQAASMLGREFL